MDPSLDNIALFVEVAKIRNFTRAAQSLNMSASTLSRRISELERYIGVRLLKRSTRKVELTEAGRVYFERCQHVVAKARMAHEELVEATQQPKGRLRISMPSSFALIYMPTILLDFSKQYPEIDCECDLGIQAVDLLAESFDVVIRFGRQPDSGVVSRQLASTNLHLYASAEYLARYGVPTAPADLAQHECLRASASKEDSTWELNSGSVIQKVPIQGRLTVNNVSMLSHMATLGMGIVPLPHARVVDAGAAGALVRVLPEWEFSAIPLLALFPSRLMPAKTRAFIEFLSARMENQEN